MREEGANKLAYNLFLYMLTVLFIGLKLTEHIDWSWWWVFAPLWIPYGIGLILIAIAWLIVTVSKR